MSTLQIAILSGMVFGLGVAALVWYFVPAPVDLGTALERLGPNLRGGELVELDENSSTQDRVGFWALNRLPASVWAKTPHRDLSLLEIPLHRFYGQKVLYALIGLITPGLLTAILAVGGISLPFVLPAGVSIGFAVLLWFGPNRDVHAAATEARTEWRQALIGYMDLVALERHLGAGTRQALEDAATVGDSRPFRRIQEQLARASWSGMPVWDALRELGEEVGVPELDELADIMRLSGEHGAQVYENLRARTAAMRDHALKSNLAAANATGERMTIPMAMLGMIFMAILIVPSLLRLLTGTE